MAPATPLNNLNFLDCLKHFSQTQPQQQQFPPAALPFNAGVMAAANLSNNNNSTLFNALATAATMNPGVLSAMIAQLQEKNRNDQYLSNLRAINSNMAEVNNNDVEQSSVDKSSVMQSSYHQRHKHAPLQHSLSANTVMTQNNAGGVGTSPPLNGAMTPLNNSMLSATTSSSIETPHTIGSDDKPKRRSRLGGTSLKTAKVWRFFTQQPHPEQAATCQLCHKIIKATNSSTTGMIRHLRSCHPAEHEIVQEERRLTTIQKTIKNAPTDAEKLQLLQTYGMNCSTPTTASGMSGLLSSITTAASSSASLSPPTMAHKSQQLPTTPLTSFPKMSRFGERDTADADGLDIKGHIVSMPFATSISPLLNSLFGTPYLEHMMSMLKKSQEEMGALPTTALTQQAFSMDQIKPRPHYKQLINNNDEGLANNNNKMNGSGLGEHNDSEDDGDVHLSEELHKSSAAAANISPQIGATAITTPSAATSASKYDTVATAEDGEFTFERVNLTRTTLTEEDSGLLRNDSTFSPIHEDETDRQSEDVNGNGEEDDEDMPVKPSPIHFRQQLNNAQPTKRGVKRPFTESIEDSCFTALTSFNASSYETTEWTEEKTRQLNQQIALMLIIDNAPVSMVDQSGFRKLIRTLCPQYNMPSADEFTREIIGALPARLGCDFTTFRQQFQHNNPLITTASSDAAGETRSELSESGFQDCEDLENRSLSSPATTQVKVEASSASEQNDVHHTLFSAQNSYVRDEHRVSPGSRAREIKSEPNETPMSVSMQIVDTSSMSELCVQTSAVPVVDTNNNVNNSGVETSK